MKARVSLCGKEGCGGRSKCVECKRIAKAQERALAKAIAEESATPGQSATGESATYATEETTVTVEITEVVPGLVRASELPGAPEVAEGLKPGRQADGSYVTTSGRIRTQEEEAKVQRILAYLDKFPDTIMCSVSSCKEPAEHFSGRQGYCGGHWGGVR